jgi:hypothetical protein
MHPLTRGRKQILRSKIAVPAGRHESPSDSQELNDNPSNKISTLIVKPGPPTISSMSTKRAGILYSSYIKNSHSSAVTLRSWRFKSTEITGIRSFVQL